VRELKSDTDILASKVANQVLIEEDDEVIAWLLYALAFLRVEATLSVILSFARHEAAEIREAAAEAISRCSGKELTPAARDALLSLTSDSNDDVRFSAVFELGSWWSSGQTDPQIRDALVDATLDPLEMVRRAAIDALEPEAHQESDGV
jgi:HEAT repeat protein